MLHLQRLALLAELGEIGGAQILRRRLGEFGLPLQLLAGQHQVGQRQVRLDAAQRLVEGRTRDAHRLGIGPQRLQEAAERVGPLSADLAGGDESQCQQARARASFEVRSRIGTDGTETIGASVASWCWTRSASPTAGHMARLPGVVAPAPAVPSHPAGCGLFAARYPRESVPPISRPAKRCRQACRAGEPTPAACESCRSRR